MKRKIVVVTGTRAEYGILKPLLHKMNDSKKMKLHLVVTGMHLLKNHGSTINEIKNDGFSIFEEVRMYSEKKISSKYYSYSLSKGIKNFSDVFFKINPEIVVVFGDRLEALAASFASTLMNIPLAHIHGGDKTDSGHIDENIRHTISQFANIHFTATNNHTKRLVQMGQEPKRIFQVGALGIDSIVKQKFISKRDLFNELELENKKTIVCLFHPVNLEIETIGIQMNEILKSLEKMAIQSVIIYPNNDKGSEQIISQIQKFKSKHFCKIFKNLSHEKYLSLLKYSNLLLGNSSSGMIESSTIGIPVINVGTRNLGREHAENVVFVIPKKQEILKSINFVLNDKNFKNRVTKYKNPYGTGNTSKKILSVLSSIKIDEKLLRKRITI